MTYPPEYARTTHLNRRRPVVGWFTSCCAGVDLAPSEHSELCVCVDLERKSIERSTRNARTEARKDDHRSMSRARRPGFYDNLLAMGS